MYGVDTLHEAESCGVTLVERNYFLDLVWFLGLQNRLSGSRHANLAPAHFAWLIFVVIIVENILAGTERAKRTNLWPCPWKSPTRSQTFWKLSASCLPWLDWKAEPRSPLWCGHSRPLRESLEPGSWAQPQATKPTLVCATLGGVSRRVLANWRSHSKPSALLLAWAKLGPNCLLSDFGKVSPL